MKNVLTKFLSTLIILNFVLPLGTVAQTTTTVTTPTGVPATSTGTSTGTTTATINPHTFLPASVTSVILKIHLTSTFIHQALTLLSSHTVGRFVNNLPFGLTAVMDLVRGIILSQNGNFLTSIPYGTLKTAESTTGVAVQGYFDPNTGAIVNITEPPAPTELYPGTQPQVKLPSLYITPLGTTITPGFSINILGGSPFVITPGPSSLACGDNSWSVSPGLGKLDIKDQIISAEGQNGQESANKAFCDYCFQTLALNLKAAAKNQGACNGSCSAGTGSCQASIDAESINLKNAACSSIPLPNKDSNGMAIPNQYKVSGRCGLRPGKITGKCGCS